MNLLTLTRRRQRGNESWLETVYVNADNVTYFSTSQDGYETTLHCVGGDIVVVAEKGDLIMRLIRQQADIPADVIGIRERVA